MVAVSSYSPVLSLFLDRRTHLPETASQNFTMDLWSQKVFVMCLLKGADFPGPDSAKLPNQNLRGKAREFCLLVRF